MALSPEFINKFWNDQLVNRENAVVIKGEHYRLGDSKTASDSNGFGGSKFRIKLHATGEEITTFDLWHQGTVPAEFKELLPDNASWVRTIKVKFED